MAIQLRSQLSDLFLSTALPWIDYVIQEEYKNFDPASQKIFNVKEMKNGIAQTTQVGSLEPAGAVGEGEEIQSQRLYQGFDKTYTALKYGVLMSISQESIDDQKFDVFSQNPRRFIRSMMSTQEIVAANIFNNGFSGGDTGPDGVVLFSASHPLLAPGAGTASNTLGTAADLASSSLKALVTLMRGTVDSAGNKVMIQPRTLMVPKDNEFLAHELLKSQLLVNSDNSYVNAVNSVTGRYTIEPLVNDYLTDTDASFLLADPVDHNLNFYWAKRPEISDDSEFKTEVMLTKGIMRFAVGYSDWRGVVGTEGAP